MADDRRKLAQGLMMMTPSARADIAQQADEFERFKQADYLRKMGEQGAGLAKSVARGVPQMATGLVDLASMPFEAAGVLQPGQAVGSTKWLENRGYLPESQPGFANQLTELLSGGFDPSDLITKGAPMLAALRTTWHGSPHGFTKFDMSKIGTGEGAQAYGHGLYLADAKQTAEEYRRNLMGGNDMASQIAATHLNMYKTPEKAAEALQASISPNLTPEAKQVTQNAIDILNRGEANTGFLYKVELPDEQIAKMLDWDKPFSQQNETVREALKRRITDVTPTDNFDMGGNARLRDNRAGQIDPNSPSPWFMESVSQNGTSRFGLSQGDVDRMFGTKDVADLTGEQIISRLAQERGGQAQASAYLNELGIPGIQYLDQASREAGEGTRNYVVFSDEIPQILERNGQPIAQALRDYRGAHTAPGPEFGAPLHDLTGGGQMYPEDVYSRNAVQYYGTGDTKLDKESFAIAQRMRNKPEEMVDIYRAVPNEGDITAINAGDWVTINPNYAKQHGESNLPEGYKILQQKVPAKSVWTNADSIHEYGYWPE